jgi:hypothetical protein
MAAHKYTSWGRTRRPKNIAGADGTQITVISSAPTTDSSVGNSTENQRFLHIWIDSSGTTDSIIVYGFNYAVGKWAALKVPLGDPAISGNPGAKAARTFDSAYVPVEIQGSTTEQHFIVEIAGIDRVAFFQDGSTDTFTIYAACSTF